MWCNKWIIYNITDTDMHTKMHEKIQYENVIALIAHWCMYVNSGFIESSNKFIFVIIKYINNNTLIAWTKDI